MSKPPAAMRTEKRYADQHFLPDEYLFRRVPLSLWEDPNERPGPDAVRLPDLSVGRSKYAHPEWVRFDVVKNQHYQEWGVLGVLVDDIPPQFWDLAVYLYTFKTRHDPLENDYSHTEIRVFSNGKHVTLDEALPEEIHLKWRLILLKRMSAIIKPYQDVPCRQKPPSSQKLEPLPSAC